MTVNVNFMIFFYKEFIGSIRVQIDLKIGDGDGPNLRRVKKGRC